MIRIGCIVVSITYLNSQIVLLNWTSMLKHDALRELLFSDAISRKPCEPCEKGNRAEKQEPLRTVRATCKSQINFMLVVIKAGRKC